MLLALLFFALGSVVCGSAHNLNIFILGRGTYEPHLTLAFPLTRTRTPALLAFQGVGAGGIIVIGQIIIGDLVPLQERGNFNGIFAVYVHLSVPNLLEILLTNPRFSGYAFANAIGPLVGGALAQHGQWRWLFCKCNVETSFFKFNLTREKNPK
jgi:MFS family permease